MTDNKDLTENCIAYGFLADAVRERMEKGLGHGWTYFDWYTQKWVPLPEGHTFFINRIYRAIPAPVERVTRWLNVYSTEFGNVFINTYDSREAADSTTTACRRIAVWRITYNKGTLTNPVIEVEDV